MSADAIFEEPRVAAIYDLLDPDGIDLEVSRPFISFRTTFVFEADGAVFTSDSTLRFRPWWDDHEIR